MRIEPSIHNHPLLSFMVPLVAIYTDVRHV